MEEWDAKQHAAAEEAERQREEVLDVGPVEALACSGGSFVAAQWPVEGDATLRTADATCTMRRRDLGLEDRAFFLRENAFFLNFSRVLCWSAFFAKVSLLFQRFGGQP